MATELIINASLPETRIALLEEGEIQELLIERASGKGIVGNIYKGRVTRVLPGMQAAFVDIGLEKAAFLYVDDIYLHAKAWEEEELENQQQSQQEVALTELAPAEASAEEAAPVADAASAEEAAPVADEVPVEEPPTGMEWLDPEEDEDDDEGDQGPAEMGPPPEGDDNNNSSDAPSQPDAQPEGTVAPAHAQGSDQGQQQDNRRNRHYRGRRGGRRSGSGGGSGRRGSRSPQPQKEENYPSNYASHVADEGQVASDRSSMENPEGASAPASNAQTAGEENQYRSQFRSQRSRDRRIPPRSSSRQSRPQVNIQDLLKEGQEVLVQVAKDPIATKGARLTCHISLPGRHLVCMPTIDHVGVSRRIERDDERRRLRDFVERNRPRNLGFIVRTASGRQSEKRITQDIEYLSRLWGEIREKATAATAPALVYEDLNAVLRAIRDWVNEDIDKIIVDSRYHFNEIQKFVSHFMPSLRQKVELYHGDIPIFDVYNISTELSRALERKVWLRSGGYIVIDQAEALVAIDVNTGRYVGKKNLEDTILKTNLEAVQEIAYQLRLRNCGGIIIIDLIDMEREENRHRVYRALEEALKKDRARPTIIKISELGLIEMTRKRTRDTMVRTLCESCTHCEGKGFIKSKQTVAYEVLREVEREGLERDIGKILVQAHSEVIDILAIDERETLDQLERRYRKQIYLQAVADFHPEQFEVVGDKKERKERKQIHHPSRPRIEPRPAPVNNPEIVPPSASDIATEPEAPPTSTTEEVGSPSTPKAVPEDGFYDEEDRLAFLRAQAAQDAALARMGSAAGQHAGQHAGHSFTPHRGGGGGSDRGGDRGDRRRRGRRGRRGGSGGGGGFRRGPDRGPGPRPQQWASGKDDHRDSQQNAQEPKSENSGDGSNTGGPGDQSQPPV